MLIMLFFLISVRNKTLAAISAVFKNKFQIFNNIYLMNI
jgi:hypothetical protein